MPAKLEPPSSVLMMMKNNSPKNNNNNNKKKTTMSLTEKRIDTNLVGKAIHALLKHHNEKEGQEDATKNKNKKDTSLLGPNELNINIQIGLDKVPTNPSPKPIPIQIPHPFYSFGSSENNNNNIIDLPDLCIIVKDDIAKKHVQESTAPFKKNEMKCIKKIMTLPELRKNITRFEQQRNLLSEYDMFLADDRILPMLSKALGKNFFSQKNKTPVPIKIHTSYLPISIIKNLQSTFMFMSYGTCLTIKVGNTSNETQSLVDNILAVCDYTINNKIPRRWGNIRNVSIKTTNSVSLPIYNKTPEELELIQQMAQSERKNSTKESEKEEIDIINHKEEDDEKMDDVEDKKSNSKKDEKKKRKTTVKSPLVQALKKQKKLEEEESTTNDNDKKKKTTKKQMKQQQQQQQQKEPEEEQQTPSSVEKKKKKTPKKSKKTKEEEEEEENKATFIKSKSFKGSKSGYVFKKDHDGIGYYLDQKPIVNKMELDAILRASKGKKNRNSFGGNSGTKKRGKGGRGSFGSGGGGKRRKSY